METFFEKERFQHLEDNRNIIPRLAFTNISKHIKTISPEREVLNAKYGNRKYFHPISSHEDLRKKAASL